MDVKVTKSLLMTALITGSVLWGGTAAFAEESVGEFALDQIVVTATRTEKRDVEVPASTTVLTNQDLKNTGAQNLQVALGRVSGLAYKTFGPGGAAMGTMANEIAIRGISNGTLVLLNGSPMNLRGKYYLDAVPVDNVERVEIVKGGASVLYGSEAMAGVVNIITKDATKSTITAGVGNYGQQKYAANIAADKLSVSYSIEKWGKVDTIGRSHDKGDKHTDLVGSEKNNLNLNYKINDNLKFSYNYYETDVKYDVWFDGKYKEVPKGVTLQQNRKYVSKQNMLQLIYNDDTFNANLFYNQNKLSADGYTNYNTDGTYSGTMYDTDEKNRTYGFDVQKRFDFTNNNNLIVGTSYNNEFWDDNGGDGHKAKMKITDRNIYSVYAQYDHNFDDKNEIIVGARETWTTAGYNDQNFDKFCMSGQYIYKLDDNQSLYASAVQSYIMPTFAQMYGASTTAISNPDLKPQSGINYELGWKKVSNSHSWKAAIYHIDITDNITAKWNGDKSEYQYKNQDFKNTGIELTCDIKGNNGFSYNYGINYMNPKSKDSGEKASKPYWDRLYGRWQLQGGVSYNYEKWSASLQGTYLGKRVGSPSTKHSFEIKPYFLTSLTASYSADKQSSVTLTVDNILNREDNLSHSGSGEYYSTPTNFMLTYTYKF